MGAPRYGTAEEVGAAVEQGGRQGEDNGHDDSRTIGPPAEAGRFSELYSSLYRPPSEPNGANDGCCRHPRRARPDHAGAAGRAGLVTGPAGRPVRGEQRGPRLAGTGPGNPNLGTLARVGDAFGVPLTRLVEVPGESSVRITGPGPARVLWRGPSGGTGTIVAATDPPWAAELWRWTLQPGEGFGGDAHTPATRELVWVEDGDPDADRGRGALPGDGGAVGPVPGRRPARLPERRDRARGSDDDRRGTACPGVSTPGQRHATPGEQGIHPPNRRGQLRALVHSETEFMLACRADLPADYPWRGLPVPAPGRRGDGRSPRPIFSIGESNASRGDRGRRLPRIPSV